MKNRYENPFIRNEDYKKLNEFININLLKNTDQKIEWKIGYEVFGPFLVGLCQWIHENTIKQKNDRIFFLSRDGFIIRKAFEILYNDIQTNYLYVSRKSLALPAAKNCKDDSELLKSLVLPPLFTISELLKSFNIDYKDNIDTVQKCKILEDELFERKTFANNDKILKLIELMKEKIYANIQEQYDLFIEYLKQNEFCGNVAIVDIGWHNSIQNYLKKITDYSKTKVCINGYYVGVYNDAIKFEKPHTAKGYLYEYNINEKIRYKTFAFVSLLESMFLAHEGTTLKYKFDEDVIKPVTAIYEYSENREMSDIVSEFQDGAIQFIKDFKEDNKVCVTKEISYINLLNFGTNPKKEDIKIFGGLMFENFSNNKMINFNHNTLYYLFHLKELKKDFYKSGWRIVFLKKLLPFPFPHYQFFKILCQLFI